MSWFHKVKLKANSESKETATPKTVLKTVREITAQQYVVEVSEITAETHFFDDLDDSLDFQEIVMKCEEFWNVEISNDEAAQVERVRELAALIEARINPASGGDTEKDEGCK